MVRRIGRPSLPPGVEIHLDRASVPAARFLAAGGQRRAGHLQGARAPLRRRAAGPLVSAGAPGGGAHPHPLRGGLLHRLARRAARRSVSSWRSGSPTGSSPPPPTRWSAGPGDRAPERTLGLRIVAEGRGGRAWRAWWPRWPAPAPARLDGHAPPGGNRAVIRFQLLAEDGAARRGRLRHARGTVETPVFMPVGTAGSVKTLAPRDLVELGAGIILGNTYHLYLRPGHERVRRLGGLHRFMSWGGPMLTDSGGFQVYSLPGGDARDGGELAGAHRRGGGHLPQPPRRLAPLPLARDAPSAIQLDLGADVIMAFDECPPSQAERAYHEHSLARTQRWLVRCRDAWLAGRARRHGERARRSSASPRAASSPTCAGGPSRRPRRSTCPATRSAATPWARSPQEMWEGVARHAPRAAPGEAPLPHGRGHARGPAGRDRRRDRHVRLRPAHPHAPATACSSPAGAGST